MLMFHGRCAIFGGVFSYEECFVIYSGIPFNRVSVKD